MSAIEAGLTVAGGNSLSNAFIVRSNDFENVFFVAARFEGEGMSDTVGVWATNKADGSGSIFAADAFAREFSDWGDGPGFNLSDDGLSEARSCAEVTFSRGPVPNLIARSARDRSAAQAWNGAPRQPFIRS